MPKRRYNDENGNPRIEYTSEDKKIGNKTTINYPASIDTIPDDDDEEGGGGTWHLTLALKQAGLEWDLWTWLEYSAIQLINDPLNFLYCLTPSYWSLLSQDQKKKLELTEKFISASLSDYQGNNPKLHCLANYFLERI